MCSLSEKRERERARERDWTLFFLYVTGFSNENETFSLHEGDTLLRVCVLPHRRVILYLFSASLNPQYSIWTSRLGQGTARLCDFSGAFRINEYIWMAAERFPSMPQALARRSKDCPEDGRDMRHRAHLCALLSLSLPRLRPCQDRFVHLESL